MIKAGKTEGRMTSYEEEYGSECFCCLSQPGLGTGQTWYYGPLFQVAEAQRQLVLEISGAYSVEDIT